MDLRRKFRLTGIDKVMRQDEEMFVNMLIKIKIGKIDQNVEGVIKLRFVTLVIQVAFYIFLQKIPQLKDTMAIAEKRPRTANHNTWKG